jgi:hypothetical protein
MNVRLDSDPRWLRLHDQDWVCSCCGVKHGGLFDLGNEYPHVWSSRPEVRPNSEIRSSRDIQTQDFCVRDNTHFFVRCVLELPIIGSDGERFGYGVWSTLSEQNFEAYLEGFDSGDHGHLGPWFGWFSNQLAGYPAPSI